MLDGFAWVDRTKGIVRRLITSRFERGRNKTPLLSFMLAKLVKSGATDSRRGYGPVLTPLGRISSPLARAGGFSL